MSSIKEKISVLKKQRDDKKYERKLLATDYENHKELVKKSGITSLITILVYYVILLPLTHYKKSVTLMGLGRFLIPFALLVFLVSFIYFLVKGFDFFVNADSKYSKMLAEKFNINSVSDELRLMNEAITMMDVEIARLEDELYESGEDFKFQETDNKENTLQKKSIERKSTSVKRYRINLVSEDNNASDVSEDDTFNRLDEYLLHDEDEEDFESSSDMWEKDNMSRFSKL